MANAVLKMTGPTKIIELDGVPSKNWKIDPKAIHLWKGKLWKKENVGCVLCVEKEGPEFVTLCNTDDAGVEHFHCMEHGELLEVPYSMKKNYTIRIGDVIREGVEELEDTMLFPEEMTLVARNELINRLLDESQQEESEAGPAPSDAGDDD
jgi:hypothetical protein